MHRINIRLAGLLFLLPFFAACPGTDPGPSPEPEGTKLTVISFTVDGQQEGADSVGAAFAQSIAASLAPVLELTVLENGDSARTDGATYELSGTLSRTDGGTIVNARLRQVTGDREAWTSGDLDAGNDLSTAANAVARDVTAAMGLVYPTLYTYIDNFAPGERMAASPLIRQADDARSRGALDEWVEITEQLTREFSDDPAAHVRHAWALTVTWDSNPTAERLSELRERLVVLDQVDPSTPYDDLIRAYVYRASGEPGQARLMYSWILDGAALTNTARAWALRQRALAGLQVGDVVGAGLDAQEAVAIDPTRPPNLIALSKALEAAGRIDEAADASRRALALEPHWRHHQRLGLVLGRAGRFEESERSFRSACELGDNQEACANLAVVLQRAGRPDDAKDAASYATSRTDTSWGAYNLACYHALAGDPATALADLERAHAMGFADTLIRTDPDLDSLRRSRRFVEVTSAIDERLTSRRRQSSSIFPWQS